MVLIVCLERKKVTCFYDLSKCVTFIFYQYIATLYDKGIHFDRDASYSDRYSSPDTKGYRYMYLVRVLTGEYTQYIAGDNSLVVPSSEYALKDQHFDSTVNNMDNPTIFVVYSDTQAYPAYLITYKHLNIPQGTAFYLVINFNNKNVIKAIVRNKAGINVHYSIQYYIAARS